MVVGHVFQDVLDASVNAPVLSLPQYKESILKVEFGNCKDDYQNNKTRFNGLDPPLPFAVSEVFHTTVVAWRRLTAKGKECKDVYEVSFDIKAINFSFKPGDTIGIIPKNSKREVDFLIDHLNLGSVADSWYTLDTNKSEKCAKTKLPAHIPVSSTIRHVFTQCVDFRTVVKKLFLLALSRCTKNETERKILEYLSSKEGSAAYTMHILNANMCLLDILANFTSCQPSIEILFQHLPRLLPRPYSVVNSPLKNPSVLKICFSVMDIGNNRKGLTTGWIESIIINQDKSLENTFKNLSLIDNQTIPIYLRKNISGFQLTDKVDTPLILIGPGTGVGPYIGFLEQIEYLIKTCQSKSTEVWLFFGCRHPKLDFIYQEELNRFVKINVLHCLKTAFSRYENHKIKYVQDEIMVNGEHLVKLIKDRAKIFVCGDVKTMATEVKNAIVSCLVKYDDRTTEEAEKLVCDLQKDKLYIVDIWK